MAWAYVFAAIFAGKRHGKLFIPAVLILGIIPDVDLLLSSFGVLHHTFTHSLFLWLVLFAPFLTVFRWRAIPYFAAVIQHFAFGDFVVGSGVMLFWPFSTSSLGFNLPIVSLADVVLETVGLLLAAGIIYLNGDLKRLLSVDRRNFPMFLPFLALVMMLFFPTPWPSNLPLPLIAHIWSRKLLTTLASAHLILAMFLAVSTMQGLRSLPQKKYSIRNRAERGRNQARHRQP